MKKNLWALMCLFIIVACGDKNTAHQTATSDITFKGDVIVVNENAPVLNQIVIQKTQLQDFEAEFRTFGTVRPITGKYAEIAPPFAGRVVKSFVSLGQKVSADATVFELSSSDFYEATKAYFAALSENEVAQRNYTRQKELAANGVASQRELDEAQSEASIAQREFDQAAASLRIFNVEADQYSSLQVGQPLHVVSPIAGEVIMYDITIGGYVKEDADPMVVVADLSNVWVAASVKEIYFGAIKKGDRVEVYTDAHREKIIWGTIHYIGELLDEETRSLEVIVECNNADRDLKLGMFCGVHFLSSPTKAIILPSTAVMQEQDNTYVLVEIEKGTFVRRKVIIKSVPMNQVHVVSGLDEGESVIVKGGILLNI